MFQSAFFALPNRGSDDVVNLLRRPQLRDHGGSREPGEKNRSRGRSLVEPVVEEVQARHPERVVSDLGARQTPHGGLESELQGGNR